MLKVHTGTITALFSYQVVATRNETKPPKSADMRGRRDKMIWVDMDGTMPWKDRPTSIRHSQLNSRVLAIWTMSSFVTVTTSPSHALCLYSLQLTISQRTARLYCLSLITVHRWTLLRQRQLHLLPFKKINNASSFSTYQLNTMQCDA